MLGIVTGLNWARIRALAASRLSVDWVGAGSAAGGTTGGRAGGVAATIRSDSNIYLNPAAFTPQPLGTPGDGGRNQVYGPKARELDLSISKNFPIHEQWQLQFRAEAFNLTNTANFANPSGGISSWTVQGNPYPNDPTMFVQPSGTVNTAGSSFGKISSTLLGSNPRNLQFALKLSF